MSVYYCLLCCFPMDEWLEINQFEKHRLNFKNEILLRIFGWLISCIPVRRFPVWKRSMSKTVSRTCSLSHSSASKTTMDDYWTQNSSPYRIAKSTEQSDLRMNAEKCFIQQTTKTLSFLLVHRRSMATSLAASSSRMLMLNQHARHAFVQDESNVLAPECSDDEPFSFQSNFWGSATAGAESPCALSP